MVYKALNHCKFGGVTYHRGDLIPDDVIPDNVSEKLIAQKMVVHVDVEGDTSTPTTTFNVPVLDGDSLDIELSAENLTFALTVIQKTVKDATLNIQACEDVNTLLAIDVLDRRSGIKTAVIERIEALTGGDK